MKGRLSIPGEVIMPRVRSSVSGLFLFALLFSVATSARVDASADDVIFDRKPDTFNWFYKHDASLLGKLSNLKAPDADGLLIEIPAERKKTEIGIGTKAPAVWLDEFGPAAASTLTFEFDPGHTDRFSLHLTRSMGEWSLGQPGMVFYWQPDDEGAGSVYGWYETPAPGNKPPVDHPQGRTANTAPSRVRITITPGHLSVSADDLPSLDGPWSLAQAHSGFHLFVYTRTTTDGRAARMGLKRIVSTRQPDPNEPARPAVDAMFPAADRLAADALGDWLFIEEGSDDLQGFAQLTAGAMRVDVPAKHGWGRAGFTTRTPFVDTTPLNDSAPFLAELSLDLNDTSGFYFLLGGEGVKLHDDNVRRTRYAARFSVIRLPKDDHYTLRLRRGYYHDWSRPLPPDWDGRIEVLIGWRTMTVRLPGGPGILGELPVSKKEHVPYHLTLLASSARGGEISRFRLNAFSLRQLVGEGIDAQTRFRLVPVDRFDTDAYLEALGQRARRALSDFLDQPTRGEVE